MLGVKVVPPGAWGLARERLDAHLAQVWPHRVALVTGPAGSGKTTLLARFCAIAGAPTAWYRCEPSDTSAGDTLRYLRAALGPVLGDEPAGDTAEELAAAIEGRGVGRLAIVVDDVHHVIGTPAEATLGRLIECLPVGVVVVAASREPPSWNVSRLEVAGQLLRIDADDLRFRTWEVEQLFREVYGEPLPPQDLATLARRTEGWAAGLQLFHLATRGKPPQARRASLAALAGRGGPVREYLAQNVLAGLPAPLRHFLVRTSPLGRLSGPLCDEFLGDGGSAAHLAELERRRIFTVAIDDQHYRYHHVLRSHLEGVLVDELGEEGAQAEYRRAAALLDRLGYASEAVRAYSRGGDLASAVAVLNRDGEQVSDGDGVWLEHLPPSLVERDPWLLLAAARRQLADGRLAAALADYDRSVALFAPSAAGGRCRRERVAVASWVDTGAVTGGDWPAVLRAAVGRLPLDARRRAATLPGATGRLAEGLALVLAGRVDEAAAVLTDAAEDPAASAVVVHGARVGRALARVLAGQSVGDELQGLVLEAEELRQPWLGRLVTAALAPASVGDGTSDRTAPADDRWGRPLRAVVAAASALVAGVPLDLDAALAQAAEDAAGLGALTVEAWAVALRAALAAAVEAPAASVLARDAELVARRVGVPGAQAIAWAAGAKAASWRDDGLRAAKELADDLGLAVELLGMGGPPPRPVPSATPATAGLRVTTFGGLRIEGPAGEFDGSALKPRVRSALRLLALHHLHLVHRETLIEALWPGVDPAAGVRNLQVAVSALRTALAEFHPELTVHRDGQAYRLGLPGGTLVDLDVVEDAVARARALEAAGDPAAADAYTAALDAAAGPLFPEEGPAEWLTEVRDHFATVTADAAAALARLRLRDDDPARAADAAERGLGVARYRDDLWRMLIAAREAAGDAAGAAWARSAYDTVLDELGVDVTDAGRTPPP